MLDTFLRLNKDHNAWMKLKKNKNSEEQMENGKQGCTAFLYRVKEFPAAMWLELSLY